MNIWFDVAILATPILELFGHFLDIPEQNREELDIVQANPFLSGNRSNWHRGGFLTASHPPRAKRFLRGAGEIRGVDLVGRGPKSRPGGKLGTVLVA